MKVVLDLVTIYVIGGFILSLILALIAVYCLPEIREVKEMPTGLLWVLIVCTFFAWPYVVAKLIIRRITKNSYVSMDVYRINSLIDSYNDEVES